MNLSVDGTLVHVAYQYVSAIYLVRGIIHSVNRCWFRNGDITELVVVKLMSVLLMRLLLMLMLLLMLLLLLMLMTLNVICNLEGSQPKKAGRSLPQSRAEQQRSWS